MTVQELIDLLVQYEDKTKQVKILEHYSYLDTWYSEDFSITENNKEILFRT